MSVGQGGAKEGDAVVSCNSRDKGKRGEREFARVCRANGFEGVRRGQQYNGIEGEDVVGLPGVHIEVKRVEKLSLYDALGQAKRDAGEGVLPIVAHRRNNCRWVVVMDAEDWFNLYREYYSGLRLTEETCLQCERIKKSCSGQIDGFIPEMCPNSEKYYGHGRYE